MVINSLTISLLLLLLLFAACYKKRFNNKIGWCKNALPKFSKSNSFNHCSMGGIIIFVYIVCMGIFNTT